MPKMLGSFLVASNFVLVVFMFNTTRRTADKPRPADIHFTASGDLIEQMDNG